MSKTDPRAKLQSEIRRVEKKLEKLKEQARKARAEKKLEKLKERARKARAALLDWEAKQPAAGDGCHCGTCTCNPNMTPAVRFDLSPAQMEGVIREHLIRLGWTPPLGMGDRVHKGQQQMRGSTQEEQMSRLCKQSHE